MLRAIQPAMAQIDAANEDHVQVGPAGMTQHDELLMMRSSRAHPHIAQTFAAGRLDLVAQMAILLLTEGKLVQVRPPQQPLDNDSPSGRVGEYSRYSVAGFV